MKYYDQIQHKRASTYIKLVITILPRTYLSLAPMLIKIERFDKNAAAYKMSRQLPTNKQHLLK